MFTLLSEQHKKFLLKQYRLRLLGVIMLFGSALCIAGAAMLLPSYVTLYLEHARLEEETENALVQINKKNSQGLSTTLEDIKSMVALVGLEETQIYKAIRLISIKRPFGVSITSLDYTHKGDGSAISFQGIASSRSALLAFQKELQNEKIFEIVDLPISNLAKDTDVKYSIVISGKF